MPASDATYRFELAKQGRAGCQNSACKNAEVKIQKGEFRMGTLVDFQGNPSWRWKHWGCVTPLQIANLQEQVGPLEDLDLDDDLPRIIDGYEEIDDVSREKIKFALQNGHVPDEDWKGEPELNRPGMKGINKRTPKKPAVVNDEEAGTENGETPTKPKAKKGRGKKAKVESDDEEVIPVPKKKAAGKRKVKTEDDDDLEERAPPEKAPKRKASVKEEEEDEAPEEQPKKKSRAKKVKAEDEDEVIAPPAKRSRAKKVKTEDDDEVIAPPVKRSRAKKVKVEEQEDEEMAVAAPPEPAKRKRARKPKVKAEVDEDSTEEDNVKAEEDGQEDTKVSSPIPESASAPAIKTDADAGPALGDADLRPGMEESDVGTGGVEKDEAEPAKAGRGKRARKPAKGRAKS
ncbi:hypothetical protein H2200_005466 [Cladophialophora chaetospira]|uniref:PARP-type domain-containing protein n=1 Tax=Cladophialophora chaetospira TaxID=386627 RepID=A0AA38XC50_9EURO|nr:hypothetical protein H2200_005466 [Cladophialophora chaetospira]